MSLPPFLLAELRFAFRTCARAHTRGNNRHIGTSLPLLRRQAPQDQAKPNQATNRPAHRPKTQTIETRPAIHDSSNITDDPPTKELIPQDTAKRSIGKTRQVEVSLKVVPNADITPNLKLTPRERLHIEVLTRRAPQRVEKKSA
jgi:hypothetical protein